MDVLSFIQAMDILLGSWGRCLIYLKLLQDFLDSRMEMAAGTQTILPIHAYFNSQLEHIPSSEFFADPTARRFMSLAREGRLYIEGLCFGDYEDRLVAGVQDTRQYL